MIKFTKATRKQAKASILIKGLSGTGKTGLALALAKTLAEEWEDVYAIDSEGKSMSLYESVALHTGELVGAFNVCELSDETGFSPSTYKAAVDLAIKEGGKALIIDSMSHMWQAKEGVLDLVNKITANTQAKYSAWGTPQITSEKNAIFEMIRNPNIHIINTVRVKDKLLIEQGADGGKTSVKKIEDQAIIAPSIEYEPDLVLMMRLPGDSDGTAPICLVEKSRYEIFKKDDQIVLTKTTMEQLRNYLNEGVDPATLLAAQLEEYKEAITNYLDENASAKAIWPTLKDKAGVKDVQLADIPLKTLKQLYRTLTTD